MEIARLRGLRSMRGCRGRKQRADRTQLLDAGGPSSRAVPGAARACAPCPPAKLLLLQASRPDCSAARPRPAPQHPRTPLQGPVHQAYTACSGRLASQTARRGCACALAFGSGCASSTAPRGLGVDWRQPCTRAGRLGAAPCSRAPSTRAARARRRERAADCRVTRRERGRPRLPGARKAHRAPQPSARRAARIILKQVEPATCFTHSPPT